MATRAKFQRKALPKKEIFENEIDMVKNLQRGQDIEKLKYYLMKNKFVCLI